MRRSRRRPARWVSRSPTSVAAPAACPGYRARKQPSASSRSRCAGAQSWMAGGVAHLAPDEARIVVALGAVRRPCARRRCASRRLIQRCRSGAIQFTRRMPSRPFCEIAVNTSMFGMPVVKYAVLTSPHGMPTARRSPEPKSMRRVCEPSSTATILPSRARASRCRPIRSRSSQFPCSAGVAFEAEREMSHPAAPASALAATLSVGTTSKPTPGHSTTFARCACRRRCAPARRRRSRR